MKNERKKLAGACAEHQPQEPPGCEDSGERERLPWPALLPLLHFRSLSSLLSTLFGLSFAFFPSFFLSSLFNTFLILSLGFFPFFRSFPSFLPFFLLPRFLFLFHFRSFPSHIPLFFFISFLSLPSFPFFLFFPIPPPPYCLPFPALASLDLLPLLSVLCFHTFLCLRFPYYQFEKHT